MYITIVCAVFIIDFFYVKKYKNISVFMTESYIAVPYAVCIPNDTIHANVAEFYFINVL